MIKIEKVFYTKEITPENLVRLYKELNKELPGNVAIKVHSGEKGNQNFIHPEFMKPIVEYLNGTIVECNTAYEGSRNTSKKHLETLEEHGWSKLYNVDLLDEEGPDLSIPITNGYHLKEILLGKNIKKYSSMLVISHFKGHPMGGYGGALKQLSIGCSSRQGKALVHSAGRTNDADKLWEEKTKQNDFLESMADASHAVVDYFNGNIAYINIMANMSVDCDCCSIAEDPCMNDIGILASLDPIAIDKACLDLIKKSNDKGKEHFLERVNSRNGEYIIEVSEKLKTGSKEYELIEI